MVARDRQQAHRSSTPLELLFDLCFVVAVAQAGTQLHHELADGAGWHALAGYLMVFFAIWWAWVNFTWFASAYDTDDVFYRLLTLLQIAGVLVLAAGVPAALGHFDFSIMTYGYVIMRIAMIAQWIRVAVEYPPGRSTALRYAAGIGFCQICWLVRLALPQPWGYVFFLVFFVLEMLVPIWAELTGGETSWHPEHIYDRYGCFTLIVLGECVSATTLAVQGVVSEHGVSVSLVSLVVLAVGALLLVFGLWWAYFKHESADVLKVSLRTSMIWAYTHYLVFSSVAALGATLSVAVETAQHGTEVGARTAAFMVALPVAVFLIAGNGLHGGLNRSFRMGQRYVVSVAALIIALSWLAGPFGLAATVMAMAVVVAALLAVYLIGLRRAARGALSRADQVDRQVGTDSAEG
jgi:low temperature requirement protein LtrA